jgi:hypothetical protein
MRRIIAGRPTPNEILNQAPIGIIYTLSADATAGLVIPVPIGMEIVDVIVQARAAQVGGTVKLVNGVTDATNAVVCAVDTAVTHVGNIIAAQATISQATVLKIVASHATVRALVTIVGVQK